MTKDEALKLALEALKQIDEAMPFPVAKLAQKVIKEALAQPEQPKVRTGNCLRVGVCASEGHKIAPQRTWVGLTDEEKVSFWTADQMTQKEWDELFAAIEAKLKAKNT